MKKREYVLNFGMDEDVVEDIKKKLSYIKSSGSLLEKKIIKYTLKNTK